MQQTWKIIAAVSVILMVSGCASTRTKISTNETGKTEAFNYEAELQRVIGNNIIPGGFIVQKGSIKLSGTPVEGEFMFNAKMNSQGDIILSVRGPLGIEVIRVIAVGNEICIVERIGKVVYLGQKNEVMKKYGLPEDFIEIIFGDISESGPGNISTNAEGKLVVEYEEGNHKKVVTICTEEGKICKESIFSSEPKGSLELTFQNFMINNGLKYPGEITIEDRERMLNVKLVIEHMAVNYSESIEFTFPSYRRQAL